MDANRHEDGGQPQPRTPKAFGGTFSGVKSTQIYADRAQVKDERPVLSKHLARRRGERRRVEKHFCVLLLARHSPAAAGRRLSQLLLCPAGQQFISRTSVRGFPKWRICSGLSLGASFSGKA